MDRFLDSELAQQFLIFRLLSAFRMNAIALVKNKGKSITSLNQAYTINCPLIVSDSISNETALDIAKAIEMDIAYKIKALIEQTVFDTAHDAALHNVLGFLPVRKLNGTTAISAPDIINADSGKMIIRQSFAEATVTVLSEANDSAVVQNTRGSGTYLQVEVPYITGNGEIKTMKNTFTVEVLPRKVKNADLKQLFNDNDTNKMYRKYAKLTNKEEKFLRDFLMEVDDMERLAKMNAHDPHNILNFIRKEQLKSKIGFGYGYPFAFMVLDDMIKADLKEMSIDLDRSDVRQDYMKSLMLLGLFDYNPGTDIINIMYDGDRVIKKYTMSDFTLSASKYEKELSQLIRLNKTAGM